MQLLILIFVLVGNENDNTKIKSVYKNKKLRFNDDDKRTTEFIA